MRSKILVYADDGAWFSPLLRALVREVDPTRHDIQAIGAAHILSNADLFENARLLVMPGGADKPYYQALNGTGNARIRAFVESGGGYVGICAGGYYAAARICWHKGRADEVLAARELAFFKGSAIGSIAEFGRPYDMTKRSASAPELLLADGSRLSAYYNGGPYYAPDENAAKDTDIIARYAALPGQPAAIIATAVGKGRAILSGLHLEVSADELAAELQGLADGAAYTHLVTALRDAEPLRRKLWRSLLDRAGASVVPLAD